jgi:hypothetical protein
MLRGERAEWQGTVTAADSDAAIAKAIVEFWITDPGAATPRDRAADCSIRSLARGCNSI